MVRPGAFVNYTASTATILWLGLNVYDHYSLVTAFKADDSKRYHAYTNTKLGVYARCGSVGVSLL